MREATNQTTTKKKSNPRVGLAIVLAFATIATLLAFLPSYFSSWTYGISITLFIISIMGLGIELNTLSSHETKIIEQFEEGKGIFDNLFIGLGLFFTWMVLYYYFNSIVINIFLSIFLLLGVYGMFLGTINWIVNYNFVKRNLEEQRINSVAEQQKKEDLIEDNSKKYQQAVVYSINIIAIFVSIPASIVAVVTFLDQIGVINVFPKP